MPTLILWTEKGVARHAKILDTDEAWKVYEAIKRSQLDIAGKIIESYKVPLVLVNEIDLINSQLSFSEEAV